MAMLQRLGFSLVRVNSIISKHSFRLVHEKNLQKDGVNKEEDKKQSDMPIELENPFEKEKPKCVLCQFKIEPDYKNVRLLSQFVSRHSGKILGRHITGLCEEKQKKLEIEIHKARAVGLMPTVTKIPKYFDDPQLYDPDRPLRPHPY